jgi:hypothetical protein
LDQDENEQEVKEEEDETTKKRRRLVYLGTRFFFFFYNSFFLPCARFMCFSILKGTNTYKRPSKNKYSNKM